MLLAENVFEVWTQCSVLTSSQVVFVFLERAVGQKISLSFCEELSVWNGGGVCCNDFGFLKLFEICCYVI